MLEAAPVAPEGLAEAVEEELEEDPLTLVEEPASVSEEAPSPAEPSPAEPSLSGAASEEATPVEEGEEVEGGKGGESSGFVLWTYFFLQYVLEREFENTF